jgi:hypothetical protein
MRHSYDVELSWLLQFCGFRNYSSGVTVADPSTSQPAEGEGHPGFYRHHRQEEILQNPGKPTPEILQNPGINLALLPEVPRDPGPLPVGIRPWYRTVLHTDGKSPGYLFYIFVFMNRGRARNGRPILQIWVFPGRIFDNS